MRYTSGYFKKIFEERHAILLLAVLVLAVYGNSLNNPFIWDDDTLIINNYNLDNLKILLISPLYTTTDSTVGSQYYRPLQSLSYFLDYKIWQLNPFGYHLTNMILHLLNSFLVYFLIKKYSTSWIISFIASAFFIVNPIFTTVVSYISGRADLLVFFFALLSLLMVIRFQERNFTPYYILSLSFFFAALLSKESAMLIPLFLLLQFFIYYKEKSKNEKLYLWFGYFTVLIFYYFLRLEILKQYSILPNVFAGLGTLVINLTKMFFIYLVLFLLPLNPHMGRSIVSSAILFKPNIFFPALFLLVFFIYLSYKNSHRAVFFGLLWYIVFIMPLSIFDCLFSRLGNDAIVPENNLYIASVGLLCILGSGVFNFLYSNVKNIFKALPIGVYFILLCVGTINANKIWSNKAIFYEHILESTKNTRYAYISYVNLALENKRKGNIEEAIKLFNNALKIKKDSIIYHNLGNIYLEKNNFTEARKNYLESLRLDQNFALSYVGLGLVYLKENKIDEGRQMFIKAVEIDPANKQIQAIIEKYFYIKNE